MTTARLTPTVAIPRQHTGPNPIEYLMVFLVVVAGVLALAR